MYVDLPEAELRDYRGSEREPADFDEFSVRAPSPRLRATTSP